MARRRFKRAGFNTKLIMDAGLAGVGVRILPSLLNKFVPLDPTLYMVAGAGLTYVAGSLLKKPDMANIGIALGLVELVAPMIEDLVGGVTGSPKQLAPTGIKQINPAIVGKVVLPSTTMADSFSLNDYIPYPVARNSREYQHAY